VAHEAAPSDALARWHVIEEWRDSAAVECEEKSDGTPCTRQLELRFGSAADRGEGECRVARIHGRGSRTRGGGNWRGGGGLQPIGDESEATQSASQPSTARA
jgi:hypothetical protein